jgi:hypothetical protein
VLSDQTDFIPMTSVQNSTRNKSNVRLKIGVLWNVTCIWVERSHLRQRWKQNVPSETSKTFYQSRTRKIPKYSSVYSQDRENRKSVIYLSL